MDATEGGRLGKGYLVDLDQKGCLFVSFFFGILMGSLSRSPEQLCLYQKRFKIVCVAAGGHEHSSSRSYLEIVPLGKGESGVLLPSPTHPA